MTAGELLEKSKDLFWTQRKWEVHKDDPCYVWDGSDTSTFFVTPSFADSNTISFLLNNFGYIREIIQKSAGLYQRFLSQTEALKHLDEDNAEMRKRLAEQDALMKLVASEDLFESGKAIEEIRDRWT